MPYTGVDFGIGLSYVNGIAETIVIFPADDRGGTNGVVLWFKTAVVTFKIRDWSWNRRQYSVSSNQMKYSVFGRPIFRTMSAFTNRPQKVLISYSKEALAYSSSDVNIKHQSWTLDETSVGGINGSGSSYSAGISQVVCF